MNYELQLPICPSKLLPPTSMHRWTLQHLSWELCMKSFFGMMFKSLVTSCRMSGISQILSFKARLSQENRKDLENWNPLSTVDVQLAPPSFLPGMFWQYWLCVGSFIVQLENSPYSSDLNPEGFFLIPRLKLTMKG